ncbi:hypothetical protein HK101_003276 [Irineochytrium annulatum]|nr:hypothetical protein HK101_003276 [Irineochytrium annulatum]
MKKRASSPNREAKHSDIAAEPLPKGFQRIQIGMQKKAGRGELGGSTGAGRSKTADKKRPNETIKEYSRCFTNFSTRLEADIRKTVSIADTTSKTAVKRKARLKERKKKLQEKRRKGKTEEETLNSGQVLFGVQASEPPTFKVVPKKIGKARLGVVNNDETDGHDEKDGAKKTRWKSLSLVQRRNREEERERVIELYRAQKGHQLPKNLVE